MRDAMPDIVTLHFIKYRIFCADLFEFIGNIYAPGIFMHRVLGPFNRQFIGPKVTVA
jgi:hypothetical protein